MAAESRLPCRHCAREPGGHHATDCPKRTTQEAHRIASILAKRRSQIGARRFDLQATRLAIALGVMKRNGATQSEIKRTIQKILG